MTSHGPGDPRLWGRQSPFERNHLQRGITLAGLVGVFVVTMILLVHADVAGVLGIGLVCGGVVSGLAAVSRLRYVRETRAGFAVLRTRDGRFVMVSASALVVVAGFVIVLILG